MVSEDDLHAPVATKKHLQRMQEKGESHDVAAGGYIQLPALEKTRQKLSEAYVLVAQFSSVENPENDPCIGKDQHPKKELRQKKTKVTYHNY